MQKCKKTRKHKNAKTADCQSQSFIILNVGFLLLSLLSVFLVIVILVSDIRVGVILQSASRLSHSANVILAIVTLLSLIQTNGIQLDAIQLNVIQPIVILQSVIKSFL
jgi:hypothetical protein